MKVYRIIFLLFFILLIGLTFIASKMISNPKEKAVIESRAFSCGAFNPPAPQDVAALQNQINSAQDGAVINLPTGTYFGPVFTPLGLGDNIFVSAARGASDTCLIRIDGKKLTLKGAGSNQTIFYGEGHSRPYQDPYQTRGGICIVNNAQVTLDNLRVKEFQKRCVVVYNSSIVVKNSIIEGCDEGGVSLLGNSSGLIVDNFFQSHNFGGIMLWQNSQAKIVNNILNHANVMFFFHPGTADTANAEIINNVFSGGSKINQVDWWKSEAAKLQNIKASYNLFDQDSAKCTPPLEYCNDFPGKLTGDPLYTEPVADMCGIAPWGNFSFKEGSPAVGVGDPGISGPKTLGWVGGPCVDANSSICASFIQNNLPQPVSEPTPTPAEEFNPEPTLEPTRASNIQPTVPTINRFGENKPTVAPIYNNVFSDKGTKQSVTLSIENNSGNKLLQVKGLVFSDAYSAVNKEVMTKSSINYDLSGVCNRSTNNVSGGIFYTSSSDANRILIFKNLVMDCQKNQVVSIE